MSKVDIKLFEDSKNLLIWFIRMNFPEGYDEDQDISLGEFMDENYEIKKEEIDLLTQFHDGVFDENDGYVENPNTIVIICSNGKQFSIAFHPGDTEYYIDNEMVGCTGPEYEIRKIPYREYKCMVNGLSSVEKLFVLPMVCVSDGYENEFKEEIELILSDIHIEDTENAICSFILANSIE